MLKCISFNVNGLRAILKKDFIEDFNKMDADIVALQETKLQAGQHDFDPEGYTEYWNYAERKGYSGTAIFSKRPALSYTTGIGIEEHDKEGRVITLEFDTFYFVNVYTPNSQDGLKRLSYRMQWEEAFQNYLQNLDTNKPVILCGDLNVAHEEIDLKNPDTNHFSAGFSDEERAAFSALLSKGFIDTFRHFYPDKTDAYSWWSYRTRARERNVGWRIDYFVVSERLKPALISADILNDIYGSDHCPVQLCIEL
ncbi:MAG: exodeoxyribonuclease III [Bradymonadales bacterium]|jgi:exodeoxyribonuclease-3